MLHRHTLGRVPPKPHTALHSEDGQLLMEQMITREGFHGPFSILYYRTPPTDEFEVDGLKQPGFCPFELIPEQPLHRRHLKTQDLKPGGARCWSTSNSNSALSSQPSRPAASSPTATATSCISSQAAADTWKASTASCRSARTITS